VAWTPSSRWSAGGTGSVLQPDYWVPAIEEQLPLYYVWSQFLGQTYGGVEISGPGMGRHFKLTSVGDLTVVSTALTEGTEVPAENSTALSQVTGTLKEYGKAEVIANFADWVSSVDMQAASAISLAKNAMKSRDKLIGDTFLATTNYFACTNGSTIVKNGSGTLGTAPLNSTHVRKIADELRRMGVEPFEDGLYRWVGTPGMFETLKAEVANQAAYLGRDSIYAFGQVMVFGGFSFIEEVGSATSTTYGGTGAGTTVVFGRNAVYGYDNFLRPDLITYYADAGQDFGRVGKAGWYAVAGYVRPVDGTANGRVWNVYHAG